MENTIDGETYFTVYKKPAISDLVKVEFYMGNGATVPMYVFELFLDITLNGINYSYIEEYPEYRISAELLAEIFNGNGYTIYNLRVEDV